MMTKKRILTLVTGGFDPLHSGHIAYFEQAKDLTNYLVVGLNTEEWLTNKKGQYFMSWKERAEIIRHLDVVDAVITVEDDEYGSACSAIERCLEIAQTVVFANGGDRGSNNTPEMDRFGNDPRVEMEFGVGGTDKKNSSSWLLHNYFERQRKIVGIYCIIITFLLMNNGNVSEYVWRTHPYPMILQKRKWHNQYCKRLVILLK